jgi:hypothetical protein
MEEQTISIKLGKICLLLREKENLKTFVFIVKVVVGIKKSHTTCSA